MENSLKNPGEKRWILPAVVYAAIFLLLAGILNYTLPYSSDPWVNPPVWAILLWSLLYLPLILLPVLAHWKVNDFGFRLNLLMGAVTILTLAICSPMFASLTTTWATAGIEAFARTGEEVFFRGFLFSLFTHVFRNRRWPWLWAAILSSLLFASVHTQTFQSSFFTSSGTPPTSIGLAIFERLFSVFQAGLVFALLRAWTGSILPGAVIHCLSSAGIQTLPFVLVIYFGFVLWARLRGEQVVSRLDPRPDQVTM